MSEIRRFADEIIVLCGLYSHIKDLRGGCSVGYETLSKNTNLSATKVRRVLLRLKEKNIVTVQIPSERNEPYSYEIDLGTEERYYMLRCNKLSKEEFYVFLALEKFGSVKTKSTKIIALSELSNLIRMPERKICECLSHLKKIEAVSYAEETLKQKNIIIYTINNNQSEWQTSTQRIFKDEEAGDVSDNDSYMGQNRIFGYCGLSDKEQQKQNILKKYPNAYIFAEFNPIVSSYSKDSLGQLKETAKTGDTVVFTDVSKMGDTVDECIDTYRELATKKVAIVFLNDPHCNTDIYTSAIDEIYPSPNYSSEFLCEIAWSIYNYTKAAFLGIALKQIRLTFKQNNHSKPNRKIAIPKTLIDEQIIEKSKYFNGNMSDQEIGDIVGLSRTTIFNRRRALMQM